METLTLVLLLVIAVLLSAIIDQIVPRVSLPLIQVAMGIVIALFARGSVRVSLEPELFLVLFIAPLLYIEAKNADKALLWRNLKPILSLAIGLVVVSTLILGFSIHALYPSITLAAAFALGAALGPTDAVAVTSLSKQVSLPERQWGILKGELLLNDASGIVSFQFALGAATTGAFSLLDAGSDFLLEFVGGLVFGLVIGFLANMLLRKIRDLGIENTTFHVLYEICIPFVVYLASSAFHVSGIIAVVTTGLVNVIAPRTVSPSIAQMNIVSNNVWEVISFALNGIVFVMLGTQIPTAMSYTWQDDTIGNLALILFILFITFLLMAVRFIWCLIMEYIHKKGVDESHRFCLDDARNALIITLCGAKGTITLSILFTIPYYITTGQAFPERNLIIFLGCGVILCTLLMATYLVPLVAPKRERKQTEIEARQNYFECLNDIHRSVIEALTAQQDATNKRATRIVIRAYQDRLEDTKNLINDDDNDLIELRLDALDWEQERVLELIENGTVTKDIGYDYLGRLERMEKFVKHGSGRKSARRLIARLRILIIRIRLAIVRKLPDAAMQQQRREEMRALQIDTNEMVVRRLRDIISDDDVQTEDASKLLMEYERALSALRQSTTSVTTTFKIVDESEDIWRLAYQIELEEIQKAYEQDRINRQEANQMRDNVFLMQMDLDDTF